MMRADELRKECECDDDDDEGKQLLQANVVTLNALML